uniref:Uncharacterized protein n=1 Tax=Trypanosoma congolense (strain IL3000) TaxID=1068625 RepID=G0UTS5_TRYCI|nr:hypothetical protein, unlikely [Trypanosoma congolense IL3000]
MHNLVDTHRGLDSTRQHIRLCEGSYTRKERKEMQEKTIEHYHSSPLGVTPGTSSSLSYLQLSHSPFVTMLSASLLLIFVLFCFDLILRFVWFSLMVPALFPHIYVYTFSL